MYKPVQKKSSSWTPASSQSKSKSLSKPGTFSVQPKSESKSSQQQEIPSYSPQAADALAANVMRSLETPQQSVEEGKDLDEMSEGAGAIQTKLTVGAPGDKYEQEADQVAAQVMSMSITPDCSPQVQRFGEEDNPVQRWSLAQSITPVVQRQVDEQVQMRELVQRAFQAGGNEASGDLESRLNASKGGGSALSKDVRSFMEPRFGADFSSVRVHTGGEAVQMNRELGAQAFAHGSDVYFGAGKSPGNNELTAHELTHVVQQTGNFQTQPRMMRQDAGKSSTTVHRLIQCDTRTPESAASSSRAATDWNREIRRLDRLTQAQRQRALQGIRARGQWEEMLNALGNRHVATIQRWLNEDVGDGHATSLEDRLRVAHNSDRAQRALASIDNVIATRDPNHRITPRLRELLALGVALPKLDVERPAPTGNPIADVLGQIIGEIRAQNSITQEGVLTIAQVDQAINALIWMPRREYLRLSLLLELTGDRSRLTQSFLLLKATAARAETFNPVHANAHRSNLRSLERFSNLIRDMDQQTAVDQTSATATSAAHSVGLTQKFTDSCGPTAAQLIRAEADPIEALRMNQRNELGQNALSNPTARQQEAVLERHSGQTAVSRGQATIISAITAALPGSGCTAHQRQAVLDYINGRPFSHSRFAIGITKLEKSMGNAFPGATALRMVREGNAGTGPIAGLTPGELVGEANNQLDVDARTGRRWQDLFDNQLWTLFNAAGRQVTAVNMAAWNGRVTALLNQAAPLVENGNDMTFIVYWHGGGGHFMTFTDVRTFNGQRRFLVHDPWTGTTQWMTQSTILAGGPWPPGGQGLLCGLQG